MKLLCVLLTFLVAECAVLDPALYLAPSPPLMLVSDSIPPEELWERRSFEEPADRTGRVASEIKEITQTNKEPIPIESRMFWPTYRSPEPTLSFNMPLKFSLSGFYGKLPSLPTSIIGNTYGSVVGLGTGLAGLTTSVAGLGTSVTGLGTTVSGLGTTAAGLGTTVTGLSSGIGSALTLGLGKSAVAGVYGNYGRSGLAGSSYGTYGTSAIRVYGGDNTPSWSGWGNGKWGHYGKG